MLLDKALPETQVRRMQDDIIAGYRGPEYGETIGLLRLRGEISAADYHASKAFQALRVAWLQAIEHSGGVKARDLTKEPRSQSADADSPKGKELVQRASVAIERYQSAWAVIKACGAEAREAFLQFVCPDGQISMTWPNPRVRADIALVAKALRRHREAARRNRYRLKVEAKALG